jgi:CRISPR-associated protein Csd2
MKFTFDRIEGVLLIDFTGCNPCGDPDAENRPRSDPHTRNGLIMDATPKRKIRDYLKSEGHDLYIDRGACLETVNSKAAASVGCGDIFENTEDEDEETEASEAEEDDSPKPKKKTKKTTKTTKKVKATPDTSKLVFDELAKRYIDFRLFGGTVPRLIGSGRGPIQFSVGETIDPITILRVTQTRVAVATEEEAKEQSGANRGMGSRWYLPYGLYRFHWYLSPSDAMRTKMTEADYVLFLKAMLHMFDNDRASGRVRSCVRLAYEFRHHEDSQDGLSGERLLETIRVVRKDKTKEARSFNDYEIRTPKFVLHNTGFTVRNLLPEVETDEETDDDPVAAE